MSLASAALAVSAHALAGGGLPHLSTTVVLGILIGWVSTAVADRTRGLPGILLVLGSAQLLTHLVLAELSGHAAGGPAMTASHVVATVFTACLLAHAESMLLTAVAALSVLLPVVWGPVPVGAPAVRRSVVRPAGGTTVVDVLLRRVHRRRGPPALS